MWETLKREHIKMHQSISIISDMCKGDVMHSDSFFDVPEHVGLMLCTDGVPVFKSSGMLLNDVISHVNGHPLFSGNGLWPVELSIVNLPPHLRFNRRFIILASIWYGPNKPDMNTLLQPVLTKLMTFIPTVQE